jgi:hypothetical protein
MKEQYDDRDKDYAKLRNSLIPEAEKFANKYCGVKCQGDTETARDLWNKKWSSTFIRRMNHLYAETQQKPICPACEGKGYV